MKSTHRRTLRVAAGIFVAVLAGGGAYAGHLTKQDLDQLIAQCEAEREKRIAPLRENEIRNCIATGAQQRLRNPEQECQSYFRDFGDARWTGTRLVPRMFHNLAECARAEEEHNHFRLHPK